MDLDGKKIQVEREQTNEGLRVEREKTDQALAERQTIVDENADQVVKLAREEADAVLDAAREKADQRLKQTRPPTAQVAAIAEERATADDTLRDERNAEDVEIRHDRDAVAHAAAKIMPLEREETDRYLVTERAVSDDAISHRDDFLGIVSHDLRNLLSGIVLNAALISENAPENDLGKQTLVSTERIQRFAARMNRLIGDLLDIASIDAGKLAVTPTRGDLTTLIAEALDTFRAAASNKGISLETEIVERPLLAEFDHDRVLQVLANLITNSIKFTSSGGKIRIHGERVGNEIVFSIIDTGSGVPSDKLQTIFERFRQIENRGSGVGLGLYISKCIMEAHGGRIWAESILGEGSKVCCALLEGS